MPAGTTLINGKEWLPDWPDAVGENRFARINSSAYESLDPPLPASELKVEINPIDARGAVTVEQLPDKKNRYTLTIQFDDNEFMGSENFEVEIHYAPAK